MFLLKSEFSKELTQIWGLSLLPKLPFLRRSRWQCQTSCPVVLLWPTQHGDSSSCGADRHGEDGAGVLALVRQLHVRDGDGELCGQGAIQLDSVVPQCWGEKKRRRIKVIGSLLQSWTLILVVSLRKQERSIVPLCCWPRRGCWTVSQGTRFCRKCTVTPLFEVMDVV